MKTLGETIALIKMDGNFALGNVQSDTHVEADPSTVSVHLLVPRATSLAPEHGITPRITTLAPNASQNARTTNTRVPLVRK